MNFIRMLLSITKVTAVTQNYFADPSFCGNTSIDCIYAYISDVGMGEAI